MSQTYAKQTYVALSQFLIKNIDEIQKLSLEKHKKYLGREPLRQKYLDKYTARHAEATELLAESLELRDKKRGLLAFRKLGSSLAHDSVKNELNIEEAIDGIAFLKEAIWELLDKQDFMDKLTKQEVVYVSQIISIYCNLLVTKIAIEYHKQYKKNARDDNAKQMKVEDALRISEQRNRKYLEYSEKRYRNLFVSAPIAIFTCDSEAVIQDYNLKAAELWGRQPVRGIEKYCGSIRLWLPDGTRLRHADSPIVKVLRTGVAIHDVEVLIEQPNGSRIPVLVSFTAIKNSEGVTGTITSFIDISEHKKAEQALLQKQALEMLNANLKQQYGELLILNKAKDDFISLASHQLRTPATGVKQYIGMLIGGYAGKISTSQREYLDQAYESNERQLKVVDELLKVARADSGKMILNKTPTDLVSLIKKVIADQSDKFLDKQQSVIFQHKQPSVIVPIDAEKIRSVLDNLVDNAYKYSSTGKNTTIMLTSFKTYVQVTIEDEGVGIAKKDLPQLFKKFSRIHNDMSVLAGGTGLGLYWVKRVIDLHHGSVNVTSSLRKGSTFTITLLKKPHTEEIR